VGPVDSYLWVMTHEVLTRDGNKFGGSRQVGLVKRMVSPSRTI